LQYQLLKNKPKTLLLEVFEFDYLLFDILSLSMIQFFICRYPNRLLSIL